jgi:predicted transcriptional regulator
VSTEPDAALEAWQDQKTRQAIKEANAGDFVAPEEVKRVLCRYFPG